MVVTCATAGHRYTSSTKRRGASSSERLAAGAMPGWKVDSTLTSWYRTTTGYSRSDGVTDGSNGRPQHLSHGGVLEETANGSQRLDRSPDSRDRYESEGRKVDDGYRRFRFGSAAILHSEGSTRPKRGSVQGMIVLQAMMSSDGITQLVSRSRGWGGRQHAISFPA